jgi:hypothetical protein
MRWEYWLLLLWGAATFMFYAVIRGGDTDGRS